MKGNASTSLMKTLISKKPSFKSNNISSSINNSRSTNSFDETIFNNITRNDSESKFNPILEQISVDLQSSNSNVYNTELSFDSQIKQQLNTISPSEQLSAICKNLNIKSQNNLSNSCTETNTLPPIGTKFALTMLGLSKTQNKINVKKAENINVTNKILNQRSKEMNKNSNTALSNDSDFEQLNIKNKLPKYENITLFNTKTNNEKSICEEDLLDLNKIQENRQKLDLIKKKSIEDNAHTIRSPIDPNSSFKLLIKKEILSLEERQANIENQTFKYTSNIVKNQTKGKVNIKNKNQFEDEGFFFLSNTIAR